MSSTQSLTAHLPQSTTILDLTTTSPQKIHRIEPLHRFTNIKVLNLSNHMIIKIENIPSSVITLNLEFNQIHCLENIEHLVLLEELYLSSNSIRDVASLEPNKNLKILELAHNDLEAKSLGSIAACRGLNVLTLEGNPFLERISYRTVVGMMMRSLIMLDRQAVQREIVVEEEDEKERSKEEEELGGIMDEKETIIKDGRRNNKHGQGDGRQSQDEEDAERIIKDKINRIKLDNIKLIQSIVMEQQKMQQFLEQQQINKNNNQQQQLLAFIQNKYQQSLKLEKMLKQLQKIANPTIGEQKQRNFLLQSLIENEETLEEYQRQLEQIRISNSYRTPKSHDVSKGTGRSSSQITMMEAKINALRKQLRQNQTMLIQYSNTLQSNFRTHQQSYLVEMLTKLVFGQPKQLDKQILEELCQKYYQGLLNVLNDLATVMFGSQPSLEKIQQLKQNLNGKALLDWFCDKNRKAKKDKRFLAEKENFIREFEKETEELVESWLSLKKSEDKLERKVAEFEKQQAKQFEELREKLRGVKEEHNLSFKKELEGQIGTLNQLKLQISSLEQEKGIIENQIAELNQTKQSLTQSKSELDKIKHQIRKKKLELSSLAETSQSTIYHNQSIQKKSQEMTNKYNQKYSQFLSIEAEFKVLHSKLALVEIERVQAKSQLQQTKLYLNELKRIISEEEKVLERTKTGVLMMEDKLENLNKLVTSKKYMLEGIEREMARVGGGVCMLRKRVSGESGGSEEELLIQGSALKNKRSLEY